MSEVNIWIVDCNKLRGDESRLSEVDVSVVLVSDFNDEHALRLEAEKVLHELRLKHVDLQQQLLGKLAAERQVEELREQLAKEGRHFDAVWDGGSKLATENKSLRAKLDTAMGLLIEASHAVKLLGVSSLESKISKFINTTSTEGKDHE